MVGFTRVDCLTTAHAVTAIMAEVAVAVANSDAAAAVAGGRVDLEAGELGAQSRTSFCIAS